MNINQYIKECAKSNGPISDFARDILTDKEFPSKSSVEQIFSYLDFISYQRGSNDIFLNFKNTFLLKSNYIKRLKKIILGEWKFIDGRIIEFLANDKYNIKDKNGKLFYSEPHAVFYNQLDDGRITLSMPLLPEPLAILKSIDEKMMIYDSCDIDDSKKEIMLIKINPEIN